MEIGQGSSWIPATPGKPNFTESPTICSNGQENQQAQVDWSDLQRKQALEHATGSTAEAQNAAAYRSSTSSVEEDQCFMTSEAAVGEKSEMCGGSINMYNNFASDNVDLWSSVSFGDLLAMAHAGGSGTTPADETAYSVKSSFQPLINTQNADLPLPLPPGNQQPVENQKLIKSGPIIEVPATPEPIVEVPSTPEQEQIQAPEIDIEDAYFEDPNEIPMIELNMAEFTQNVKKYVENNMELHQVEMSNALVALTSEAASIPTP